MRPGNITATECDILRRQRETGLPVSELAAEHAAAKGAVRAHVYGRCTHDTPPLDTDAVAEAHPTCEHAVREALDRADEQTRRDLAETTDFSPERVGEVLRDLKSEGVVRSRPSFSDPRKRVYSLADEVPEAIPE